MVTRVTYSCGEKSVRGDVDRDYNNCGDVGCGVVKSVPVSHRRSLN